MEIRKVELRKIGSPEEPILTGYAARYNSPSEELYFGGREVILPGAFSEALVSNKDIFALVDHDDSKVIARRSNDTLKLVEDNQGLRVEIKPNVGTSYGKDIVSLVERKDITGMSIGMIVKDDEMSKVDGKRSRTIKAAELLEVSIVASPAYSETNITRRGLTMKDKKKANITVEGTSAAVEPKEVKQVITPSEHCKVPAAAISAPVNDKLEIRKAFNHYLRTGETRAMMVSDPLQGVLAPEDFATDIIEGLKDISIMRQIANVLPAISGKSVSYPRRTGGTGTTFVAEGAAITPHDLTFDQIVLTPKKIGSLVPVTNELLDDAAVDLAGYLSGYFRDEIAEVAEANYWTGTGAGANPTGILHGATLTRITTAAPATLDADDVLALWHALPAKYRRTAVFVCNSALEAVLRGLKDASGRYLLVADMARGLGNTLLGRPLLVAESFPGVLTTGLDVLALGDFKRGVYIADKKGIDIQRNDSVGFTSDTVHFRALFRTDIQVALADCIRVMKLK